MAHSAKSILMAAAVMIVCMFFSSCEEDLTTLGDGVVGDEPFTSEQAEYNVFAYSKRIEAVQTNQLPLYLLGTYRDPVFGNTEATITTQVRLASGNPRFGDFTQVKEDDASDTTTFDEEELIKDVFLYIPYQQVADGFNIDNDRDGVPERFDVDDDNPDSDSDGDLVSDIEETRLGSDPLDETIKGDEDDFEPNNFIRTFPLDSIYGGGNGTTFNLKVERSTYFLRDLNPDSGFLEREAYFSNRDFSQFTAETFFDGEVTISDKEYAEFLEDDPDTEADEEGLIDTDSRRPPGIRVPLNKDYFQQNILDKEGSFELLSQANFVEFFRGIRLSLSPIADEDGNSTDLAMLLNLADATITINYKYNDRVTTENSDGETTTTTESVDREFTLRLLQLVNNVATGNALNSFSNPDFGTNITHPLVTNEDCAEGNGQEGTNNLENIENASRLFVKGGAGAFAKIYLFSEDEAVAKDSIAAIRARNWVVNEANLEFYVDRESLGNTQELEPRQLYLYNQDSNAPVYGSSTNNPTQAIIDYGGILETEDNLGVKYKIRLTEYLNNIIQGRDSLNNPLILAVTSNLQDVRLQEVGQSCDNEAINGPLFSTINPSGTVLFGNNITNPENEDKKLKLKISYTVAN